MKKILLVILMIMSTSAFASVAFAYTGGLVHGNYAQYSPTGSTTTGTPISTVTDGNDTTFQTLSSGASVFYKFDKPVTISHYQGSSTPSGTNYAVNIYGKNSKGQTVITGTFQGNQGKIALSKPVDDIVLIYVVNQQAGTVQLRDFDVFGEVAKPPSNTETDKFVITGLRHSVTSSTAITLMWNSVQSQYFKHYNVYQESTLVTSVTSPLYSFSGLEPGKTYTFKIAPVDTFDKEFQGDQISYTVPVPDTTPPTVPVLSGTAGDQQVQLQWTASPESDLDSYTVYQDGKKIVSRVTATSLRVNSLSNDKEYKFSVTASDTTGNESAKSNEVRLKPVEPPKEPPPVTDSEQEVKPDYLLVKWTETPEAVGYIIYLNGREVGTTGPEAREFKITKDMGYNPNIISKGLVKPKLADGSVGGGKNDTGGYQKPSFGATDIWTNVMLIVSSMAGFLLLGIVIRFTPRIFPIIKESIQRRTY